MFGVLAVVVSATAESVTAEAPFEILALSPHAEDSSPTNAIATHLERMTEPYWTVGARLGA
jgi:hypothetical protein